MMAVITSVFASAQQHTIKFHSINSAGLIAGANENNLLIQSVNGIAYGTWYFGIGLGLDYYKYNTMPLFADIRRTFGKTHPGFIYGDIGFNFPYHNKPGSELGFYNSYTFEKGLYTDIGLGYKTKLIKKSSVIFTIGHSYKSLKSKMGIVPQCLDCPPYFYDFKFGYGRVFFKTGVEF